MFKNNNPDIAEDTMSLESDSSEEMFDWDTDDELEMEYLQQKDEECDQAAISSSSSSDDPAAVERFVAMGFDKKMVIKALKESSDVEDNEAILNRLLSYPVVEDVPREDIPSTSTACVRYDDLSDDSNAFEEKKAIENVRREDIPSTSRTCIQYEDLSDGYSASEEDEENAVAKDALSTLIDMGYQLADALKAIEKYGSDAPLDELTDYIFAAQTADQTGTFSPTIPLSKRQSSEHRFESTERRHMAIKRARLRSEPLRFPCKMMGFGVPGGTVRETRPDINKVASGPPYFYYENVAFTPKGVWESISRFLYDIEPEFVDSLHFSAAARKRGYIHNLPIKNRQPLLPIPPKTIHEALPHTKKWWPAWDKREKFNCILTCIGSAPLAERVRKRVESGRPSESDKEFVIKQCKKWNLVWVGKNKVAPLEPHEMELLLGFPPNHTRGGGISRTDQYKSLGNTFQIDTVAYHLSVLKPIYPQGMNVLSLFSGIGGAEVALHRLGIRLKTVVSVEISAVNRKIMQDWWEQTEQTGNLIHVDDVQKVDHSMLRKWIRDIGGFDLVIGGSPCNNLAGGNRRTRDGLEGEHSSLFFQYYRILDLVRNMMRGS